MWWDFYAAPERLFWETHRGTTHLIRASTRRQMNRELSAWSDFRSRKGGKKDNGRRKGAMGEERHLTLILLGELLAYPKIPISHASPTCLQHVGSRSHPRGPTQLPNKAKETDDKSKRSIVLLYNDDSTDFRIEVISLTSASVRSASKIRTVATVQIPVKRCHQ